MGRLMLSGLWNMRLHHGSRNIGRIIRSVPRGFMTFKNKPGVNDPDLLRPSPDVVNQAHVVLALREHYQRGFNQGISVGVFLGVIAALIGVFGRRWLFS